MIEVIGAEIGVCESVFQHVVDCCEHGCGDGADCLLGAAAGL